MPQVWVQRWEESERDWGCRPDGYSIHLTEDDVRIFVSQRMLNQRLYFEKQGITGTPDEYCRPCGKPYLATIDQEQFVEIDYDGHVNGKKFTSNQCPPPVKKA